MEENLKKEHKPIGSESVDHSRIENESGRDTETSSSAASVQPPKVMSRGGTLKPRPALRVYSLQRSTLQVVKKEAGL
jgi:hypothetical protein